MNIDEIQKEINRLFGKYSIPAITKNLPMENLHKWSDSVSKHFNLDADKFQKSVTELFWSIAHVQLSLGYSLIARQSCSFPKGTQGTSTSEEGVPNMIQMPEIHFWFHIYNCYECIYRCWERVTVVMKNVCYPQVLNKKYFNQIINDLKDDPKYNKNKFLSDLQKHECHWVKIAEIRNELSHGESSPFRNTSIEGTLSEVLGIDGLPIPVLNYSAESIIKEIEEAVEKYRRILPVIKSMKDFIDSIGI